MQVCRGGLREVRRCSEVGDSGYIVDAISISCRYFADSVRDDYAAGQLDAQVTFIPSDEGFLSSRLLLRWRVFCKKCGNSPYAAEVTD